MAERVEKVRKTLNKEVQVIEVESRVRVVQLDGEMAAVGNSLPSMTVRSADGSKNVFLVVGVRQKGADGKIDKEHGPTVHHIEVNAVELKAAIDNALNCARYGT